MDTLERDERRWRLGTDADVACIDEGTDIGTTITSAIPAMFDAYATIVLPEDPDDQVRHDEALLAALREHATDSRWWLGYLDTGADDVVFAAAPRVHLYADWPYALVSAGPEQAATWRRWEAGSFWSGQLPNPLFPADRCWLVSTLWDDDWTCVGGTTAPSTACSPTRNSVRGLVASNPIRTPPRPATPPSGGAFDAARAPSSRAGSTCFGGGERAHRSERAWLAVAVAQLTVSAASRSTAYPRLS